MNKLIITDLVTTQSLTLQFLPQELEFKPTSSWATVKPNGRNNPIYRFTGSEDILEFDISWVANIEQRTDVLVNCRWLEALSKSNGYVNGAHEVLLTLGNVFATRKHWIIESAEYNLSLFHPQYDMMPTLATQKLKLKRVVEKNPNFVDLKRII